MGQPVSSAVMALGYDAGTNTAHFTFPGYPNGLLPNDDYTATMICTLTDSFGNPLGVETPFDFSVFSSSVVGRDPFYHNSALFDQTGGTNGRPPGTFSDDNAIATDKTAYLPNGTTTPLTATAPTFASVSG